MSDGTGDAPRLPPRPPRDPASQQLALDLVAVAPMPTANLATDWPSFEEPPLLPLDWARRAVAVGRLMSLGWGIAVVVFASRLRSDAQDGSARNSSIEALAATGVVVALALAFTGWRWSDRVTRNVHLMGGRLPNRARCARAWSLPVVCAGLLWLTVFRMDPTEGVDVRPAVVITIMVFAIWRPYALIRRIIATLSRVRSDAVIAVGFVFDFSAFALLGWQLVTWPSAQAPVSEGRADTFLGVAAAAAIGLALNVVNWGLLTGAVEAAEADRVLTLRTRHDHRHLRLRGINPMDPDVRWALLRVRQQEELERRWRAELEAAVVAPEPVADDDRPTIATPASPRVATEPTTTRADLVEPASRDASSQAELAREQPPEEVVAANAATAAEDDQQSAAEQLEELEGAEARADLAPEQGEQTERETFGEMAARLRTRLTGEGDQRRTTYPTIEPAQTGRGLSRLARSLDQAASGATPSRRANFASRIAAATGSSDDDDLASRRDRFVQRLNDTGESTRPDRTLLERLNEYGIAPNPDAAQTKTSLADEYRRDEERWIPPRLFELEFVRYLMLAGIIAVAVTSALIVVRTGSAADALIGGEIMPGELDRINSVRRAFVTALSITLALVPLWAAVFLSHARRAAMPAVREWRAYLLLAIAIALNVVGFLLDGEQRGTTSLLCLCGCLGAAMATVTMVVPAARWFQRRTTGLALWAAGLAFVTIASWVGGLQRPVDASHALEALTFVAALQAIATAVVVVIAALNTSDLEEAIRLSPELQDRPHRSDDVTA